VSDARDSGENKPPRSKKSWAGLRFWFIIFSLVGFLVTIIVVAAVNKKFEVDHLIFETMLWLFLTVLAEMGLNLKERSDERAEIMEQRQTDAERFAIVQANLEESLEKIALSAPLIKDADHYILGCFVEIAKNYSAISDELNSDKVFYALCRERITRLVRAGVWEDMARGHIYYDNPLEELPVAGILIASAKKKVDAVAKMADDLAYLQSERGLDSLEKQRQLQSGGVMIRRLLVLNPEKRYVGLPSGQRESGQSTVRQQDLFSEALCVAKMQMAAEISVRILIAPDGAHYANVPDLNIIDDEILRVAEPISDDEDHSYMTANVFDLRSERVPARALTFDYEAYWKRAKEPAAIEQELGISCPRTCGACPLKGESPLSDGSASGSASAN
jgi:hypothetical protein